MKLILWLQFIYDKYCYGQRDDMTFSEWQKINGKTTSTPTQITQVIAASLALLLVGCGINGAPGEGEKIGTVVKLKKQGLVFDTWEAELIRGGMNGGSGSFGTTSFHFTVPADMVKDVKDFMNRQAEVKITYKTKFIYGAGSSDSGGDFLTAIEAVNH